MNPWSISTCARAADARRRSIMRLSAIKGVGEAQAEALVEAAAGRALRFARRDGGAARSRAVNKKALESLAAAGAFDCLERDRATAFAAIEPMLAIANRGAIGEERRARTRCSAKRRPRR